MYTLLWVIHLDQVYSCYLANSIKRVMVFFSNYFYFGLRVEPRASCVQSTGSTTEVHHHPNFLN